MHLAFAYNAGITQAWIGIVVGNPTDNSTWTLSDGSKLNYTNWGTSVDGENVTGYIDSMYVHFEFGHLSL